MPKINKNWMNKQNSDPYYRKAKKFGVRARSYYKIEQIDQKYDVFNFKGKFPKKIIDLGCAPGAWLQYALNKFDKLPPYKKHAKFRALGIDLTTIKPFENRDEIEFFRGNIFKEQTIEKIKDFAPVGLILSDLAPKTSGDYRDVAIQESMIEYILSLIELGILRNHGNLAIKVFQSERTQEFLKKFQTYFYFSKLMKPKSSRDSSREIFLIGIDLNPMKREQTPATKDFHQ